MYSGEGYRKDEMHAEYSCLEISDWDICCVLGGSGNYVVYCKFSVLYDYVVAEYYIDFVGCYCCSGLGVSEQLLIISEKPMTSTGMGQ